MKNKFLIIGAVIFIGVILGYLYIQTGVSHPQEKFKKYRKAVYLKGNTAKVDFDLPQDAYLLKIKHMIQENQPKKIYVNGFQVTPGIFHHIRRRGVTETSYMYLPKKIVKEGKNYIDITFSKNWPPDVDIILSNYRRQIENVIYILFSDSKYLPLEKISFKITITMIILVSLLFGGMIYFLNKIFSLSINRLFLYQIYSLLPLIIFLVFLGMNSHLNKLYKVVITPNYFWTFWLVSFFITEGSVVLRKLWQYRGDTSFIKPQVNKLTLGAIEWVRTKEFSDKCILLFMALLIMCAFLLILHLEPIAKQLANLAYFALVTGVIIKFVKFVKEEKQKE